jgi:hypothetical protein
LAKSGVLDKPWLEHQALAILKIYNASFISYSFEVLNTESIRKCRFYHEYGE